MSIILWTLLATVPAAQPRVEPGTRAHYLVLTCETGQPAPFAAVDLVFGPAGDQGDARGVWWRLEVHLQAAGDGEPLMRLWALTSRDPFAAAGGTPEAGGTAAPPPEFLRYILELPAAGQTLEYRNAHTGRALLPPWRNFERLFVPQPARHVAFTRGLPHTCEYLGHVLTLKSIETGARFAPPDARVLELDPELLVGTSRSFRDSQGHRLPQQPQRQDYDYVPFVEADYPVMIEAGINLFVVTPAQEGFVRDRPVFYIRNPAARPPMSYPADLYRSNYLGSEMFMDEPSVIMVGDERIHKTLWYFSDAAAVIEKRVRGRYASDQHYGAFAAEAAFRSLGVSFGDMRLEQWDYPSWETYYDTAYYQMAGGLNGIVHEGRYQLAEFDGKVAPWLASPRSHTAEEMLRYHYAFLRGGTRPFGKHWGTAIYGQCDPAIAPLALTLACDMGARYLWFWTSDHDHHVPWPEQLALARHLRDHVRAHRRPSIAGPPPQRDLAIVIPYGYFLSLENLWWVRELDPHGRNESSARHRRLMRRAHEAIEEALARHEDFDITVDDGRPIEGYRRIVRIDLAE